MGLLFLEGLPKKPGRHSNTNVYTVSMDAAVLGDGLPEV